MRMSQFLAEIYSLSGRTLEEDRDYWREEAESSRAEAHELLVQVRALEQLRDHDNVRIRTLQQTINARD